MELKLILLFLTFVFALYFCYFRYFTKITKKIVLVIVFIIIFLIVAFSNCKIQTKDISYKSNIKQETSLKFTNDYIYKLKIVNNEKKTQEIYNPYILTDKFKVPSLQKLDSSDTFKLKKIHLVLLNNEKIHMKILEKEKEKKQEEINQEEINQQEIILE